MNADVFKEEIALIQSEDLKQKVSGFLNVNVPEYFFTVPASASGKYHPNFASGEGGLVRHTKMVVDVLKELKTIQRVPEDVFDCLVVACILHDTFKHGHTDSGTTVTEHPVIAAEQWAKFVGKDMDNYKEQIIYYCILRHMGQWGPWIARVSQTDDAIDGFCAIVHMADYIASRKFFDKY